MARRLTAVAQAVAEVAAWWTVLAGLWLVLIQTVDTLECCVGAGAALLAALGGRAARRAAEQR
ncbi:hypothetical protein FM076_29155 [Streptomyces albus subsp. chlorinus]|uniref:hypothetical protein n=1 Tax=Streptomyces albus TaxID=1888 RepID=UPI0015709185|nr:hypothetical protein [Streptomyces albus]NSC25005.1 hypothetical protein [Streptomyces albus subsp. chlorinus]